MIDNNYINLILKVSTLFKVRVKQSYCRATSTTSLR